MRRKSVWLASLSALFLTASPSIALARHHEEPAAKASLQAAPASLATLAKEVSIPYERFTLPNGLTVLVHEDRRSPLVAVSMWYKVGSKHEPEGKTGFAHLFEHLMFNGSENVEGDYFGPLQDAGATDFNGTTWFDRTNYFQTVPTGALDRVLMMESDRMGHLLGAVTQEKLDNQISVVQNEKRQGDNRPFGLVDYEELETLYPSGHPYHHDTIGSMDDIGSASLEDVRAWFREHYGPNNAVLVLAGDIDLATAKATVAHWFGEISSGPPVPSVEAPIPTLPKPISRTIKDQVATTRIYRMWATPGLDNADYLPLAMATTVLGGLASSRLDNTMVRGREVAVSVVASASAFAQAGQVEFYADVKPGVDPDDVAGALDEEIAKFLAEGPSEDELLRAKTSFVAGEIRGLDKLGGFSGKAPTLAHGLLYSGDPAHYRAELARAAELTRKEVRDAAMKWLSRPVFALTVEPGERTEGGENRGGWVAQPQDSGLPGPAWFANPAFAEAPSASASVPDRSHLPDIGSLQPLSFPKIERATLANGIPVYFARRVGVPEVLVNLNFDAGYSADPRDALGTQQLMLRTMDQGTEDLDATQLAMAKERLGAYVSGSAGLDETQFTLNALTPNLAPSLGLLADYVRNPAFREADLARVRAQQVNALDAEMNDPAGLASRTLLPLLYGKNHPYGVPPSGLGDRDAVAGLGIGDVQAFYHTWIRPDLARLFVTGDTTLAHVLPLLETAFGDWQAPDTPAPTKNFDAPVPSQTPRILLIDRPNSPQSVILAGRILDVKGTDDLLTLNGANYLFGGNFLSRINMNLRETKGWSYGVRSSVSLPIDRPALVIRAPVQSDHTGDSIAELLKDLTAYTGDKGVTPEELKAMVASKVRELPGEFETTGDVLGGLVNIVKYGRPDDYYDTLPARYEAMTIPELDAEARKRLRSDDLVFVVVGDAAVVKPQVGQLGLPVEEVASDEPTD